MKTSALVAEFNPFHKGHRLLIDSMREKTDCVIAIMSGNFVQRGECAVFEKRERAIAAVRNGVDLVLELPAVYALSSAEGFSKGALQTLYALNVVDSLWFGSECGDLEMLTRCADILNEETPVFRSLLSDKLKEGLSYPAARQAAVEAFSPDGSILSMPNNILAVEYIKELKRLKSNITPVTIKRMGAGYNEEKVASSLPSASGIRSLLKNNEETKEYMLYNYEAKPVFMNQFDSIVAARLKVASTDELCLIPDCNMEIASRLKEASKFNTFDEIVSFAACKSYTQSRLRRILCNMITGNLFKEVPSPTYIRPLAFNSMGSEILKKIKSTASLPIAARGAILKNDEIFSFECRCTDLYNLIRQKTGGAEYARSVEIIY